MTDPNTDATLRFARRGSAAMIGALTVWAAAIYAQVLAWPESLLGIVIPGTLFGVPAGALAGVIGGDLRAPIRASLLSASVFACFAILGAYMDWQELRSLWKGVCFVTGVAGVGGMAAWNGAVLVRALPEADGKRRPFQFSIADLLIALLWFGLLLGGASAVFS